jgi:anaerobic ribonucleoside-triphosphate reductase activating protein
MRHPAPQEWLADKLSQGFVGDYKPFMFVDGEGVRCSLYVSGCLFACEGCFNRATWNFRYGTRYTAELEDRILADLAKPYVQGLTLLGGEPFLNTGVCLQLARRVRAEFGADKLALLGQLDVLVDGPFDEALKDLRLQFRGSSNQRIIDVPASLAAGHTVLWAARVDATRSYEQLEKQALI